MTNQWTLFWDLILLPKRHMWEVKKPWTLPALDNMDDSEC